MLASVLVNVGRGVGEERIKITVDVKVGEGVSLGRVGVIEGVTVAEGSTAAVCVEAALTVWAMKVPIVFGSTVATAGVPTLIAGTHARISASVEIQITNLVFCDVAIVSSSTSVSSYAPSAVPGAGKPRESPPGTAA
jgi:hypothetical protein